MKNLIFVFFTVLTLNARVNAQNWNVFNSNYRYNYKYDNDQLVSQVLFADSINSTTTFTVNHLNRIGVECKGSCPTITTALNPTLTVIVPNMPQFLQREIIKYNNGFVVLRDTAKLVLLPNCQPGQTWLFDSINNKNATCVSKSLQTVFGQPDSVKLIIVNNTDTLKLSKTFGILQFPTLYNTNKYYRLVGIENAASYDLTSLYGEKVPNAWDFYNFDVGDRFCYTNQTQTMGFSQPQSWQTFGNFSVVNKTVVGTGYIYSVEEKWDTLPRNPKNSSVPGSATARSYTNLSMPSLENKMYPGQLISTSYSPVAYPGVNIVRFSKNSNGIFFKYAGVKCGGYTFIPVPANTQFLNNGFTPNVTGEYLQPHNLINIAEVFGVGLGLINRSQWEIGWQRDYCQTCAVKTGSLYHGTETFVSIREETAGQVNVKLYPNPSSGKIYLSVGKTSANELKVISVLGQTVLSKDQQLSDQELEIDLSDSAPGIYFVQILQDGVTLSSKKVIKD